MYLALGIATVIYVAIALGVFGTLTVEQVIFGGYRTGRGRRAHARQCGLLADGRHSVVRDCRGYQCGAVSGRGLIRPAGGNGAVPRADGATAWWQGIGRAAG